MGVLDFVRGRNDAKITQDAFYDANSAVDADNNSPIDEEDSLDNISLEAKNEKEIELHPDTVTDGALDGVQKAEAVTLVWSKKAVYLTYAWIWVSFFMLALQSAICNNVNANAYANFVSAPQLTTAYILSSIIGGVIKLPIAKTLNVIGRAEGFTFFVVIYLIGMIVLASSNGPNAYAAGYVIYWIGYDAIYLILDIFIADTSGLRNRAFAFAFATTPFICTAFTGSLAAESYLKTSGWRWTYGSFIIIQPFVFLPLSVVFKFYQKKAEKLGVYTPRYSGRAWTQSVVYYFHEFDIVGAFLLCAAFVLFLLPFSLESYGKAGYKSATFIAMIVLGFLLFFVFAGWERWFARTHFIRYELFKNRTVLGACILAAVLYFSFYSWDIYYQSYLLVVYNMSIKNAGYMLQIYNVGSCFWGVVFGVWVRYTKQFKYTVLCFGVPLIMLGAGLMIHFRGDDQPVNYLIMSQIFIAFGGGTIVIGMDMAVMAAADRDGVPMMLSLIGLFSSVGGAIGQAVTAAIYDNVFPSSLKKHLPSSSVADWDSIYLGGYLTQTTYPVGSEIRNAINKAWSDSQKDMCIAATAILVLGFPAVAVWKNYRVDRKQNKGSLL